MGMYVWAPKDYFYYVHLYWQCYNVISSYVSPAEETEVVEWHYSKNIVGYHVHGPV